MNEFALQRPPWGFVVGRTLVAAVLAWAIGMVSLMLASLADSGGALAARLVGSQSRWPPFADSSAGTLLANAGVLVLVAVLLAVALWLSTAARESPVALAWTFVVGSVAALGLLLGGAAVALAVAVVAMRFLAFAGDGRARTAPVADRRIAVGLAVLSVLATGAIAARADAQPLILQDAGGSRVSAIPAMQLADLPPADRVPRARVATLLLRNLGPREVRVLGARPGARGAIRVLGARVKPPQWRPGWPALLEHRPFTLAPGAYGSLKVLFSDPACVTRRRTVALPVDVRFSGGTSRFVVRVPRCR